MEGKRSDKGINKRERGKEGKRERERNEKKRGKGVMEGNGVGRCCLFFSFSSPDLKAQIQKVLEKAKVSDLSAPPKIIEVLFFFSFFLSFFLFLFLFFFLLFFSFFHFFLFFFFFLSHLLSPFLLFSFSPSLLPHPLSPFLFPLFPLLSSLNSSPPRTNCSLPFPLCATPRFSLPLFSVKKPRNTLVSLILEVFFFFFLQNPWNEIKK